MWQRLYGLQGLKYLPLSIPLRKKLADTKSRTCEYGIPWVLACLKLFFYSFNNWKMTFKKKLKALTHISFIVLSENVALFLPRCVCCQDVWCQPDFLSFVSDFFHAKAQGIIYLFFIIKVYCFFAIIWPEVGCFESVF